MLTFISAHNLKAQELSQEEKLRVQELRESNLLQQSVNTFSDATTRDPIIVNSIYTEKNAFFSTDNSRDTEFSSDGYVFYILGRDSETIAEYHLSTPWDIETATFVRELVISPELDSANQDGSVAHGLYIRKDDGEKIFVLNRTEIWEYTLAEPWDISSAIQTGYKDLPDLIRGHSIDFKPDGSRLYVDDRAEGGVFQYNLSTNWDIETADLDLIFDISDEQEEVRGIQLNNDGTAMYLNDTATQKVLEYHISTPYDVSTASFLDSYSVRSQTLDPRAITFSTDFQSFYITSSEENRVYQYSILTPDPDESSVVTNREKVVADGSATSLITVTLRDDDGNPLQGILVRLRSDSDNTDINSINSSTNSSGQARFEASNSEEEEVTFTARASNKTINETATVRYVGVDAEESSLAKSREKVIANGVGTSRITVTARDEDGDLLEDVRITLNSDSDNAEITNINRNTNSNGEANFDVSNAVAEDVTFSARGMDTDIEQTVTVRFVGVDADQSTVTANREKVLSNGSASGTITVIIRDEDGDPLESVDVSLDPDGGNSEINTLQNPTNSDGVAEFRVTNETSEIIVYSASGLGTTISETVIINYVTVNAALSTVEVSPKSVQANGEDRSTITVTARDDDGDLLPEAEVEISDGDMGTNIQVLQNITDSNAEAFFRVTSSVPAIVPYTIVAEGIELDEKAEVQFILVAPVSLSATDVETRQFMANWEMVSGADTYILDVATDSEFTEFAPGHRERDVGEITSFLVEGIEPGTNYFYRVRAKADGLIGENSEVIQTTTFPETPVALQPINISALQFTASWQQAEGAQNYRIDVAEDPDFENMVTDFEDFETGSETEVTVTGLEAGTSYYYKVRSMASPRVSGNSNVIETSTLSINSDNSEIASSQLRVLANGEQENNISVTVKSDEGIRLEGIGVELEPLNGNSTINEEQSVTDEDGVAKFGVSNNNAETVTYAVVAANVNIGEITVEFLQDEGLLELNNNFPNPFSRETIIPFSIPRAMHVQITIYNTLGAPVRELLNEELPSGYYEIPFQANELSSGVYFYRLVTPDGTKTDKMILVK